MPLVSRTLANRYVLEELIGAGGMADVYSAEDRRLSRKVAIKLLRSDLARDPQFVSRFKKEALSAAGLNHPSIVSVFDSGEETGNSYIVMELVHGKTLRDLMHGGKQLDVEQSLEIISGVLEALEYSHQKGSSHYYEGRKYETWDVIADWELDYFLGNAIKYISRAGRKEGESLEKDLRKAIHYLEKRIALHENL